ncbi:MAG: serine protease [Bacteriovoracaceae bacterium]|nr:serine protease [Bacteriovoracaceae bacterium]
MKYLLLLLISFNVFALDAQFEGTVDLSNCSGFVFATADSKPSDAALIMTNGHCLSTLWGIVLSPGEERMDQKGSRKVGLVTARGTKLMVKTQRLVFATMAGTDMAIYSLGLSYDQLSLKGIRAFNLVGSPVKGDAVDVISGHKNIEANCIVEQIINTEEGGFSFKNSLRLSIECQQGNGTSGSPVIRAGTRDVIAIANSFNANGKSCTDNNPCEKTESGVEVHHNSRYAQQVERAIECLKDSKWVCPKSF